MKSTELNYKCDKKWFMEEIKLNDNFNNKTNKKNNKSVWIVVLGF